MRHSNPKAITTDEVIDVHDYFKSHEVVRLLDLGITSVVCMAPVTRFTQYGPQDWPCMLTGGHYGAHEIAKD